MSTENTRLRRLVTHLRACLSGLSAGSRHLLALRAGIGRRALSASTVAHILKVSVSREQLLEQLSLIELQAAATHGCAGTGGTVLAYRMLTAGAAPGGASQLTASPPWLTALLTPAILSAVMHGKALHLTSVRGTSTAQPSIALAPAASRQHVERAGASPALPTAAMIPVFAALVLGLALVALPGMRRRLIPTAAPAGGAAVAASRPAGAASRPAGAGAPVAASAAPLAASAPAAAQPSSTAEPAAAAPTKAQQLPAAVAPAASKQPSDAELHPSTHSSTGWARAHAPQAAAVVATVVAGGLARLASRTRRRGGRRR